MKTFIQLLVFCLFIMTSSCSSDNNENKNLPDAKPIILKPDFKKKLAQDNQFAIYFFKTTLRNDKEPFTFISPLSLSIALNMTLNGANGTSKSEMQTTLHNTNYDIDQINEYSKTLREALIKVDPSTQFSIANSIWYRNTFNVETSFINTNKLNYNAEIKPVDFSSNDAVNQINNWSALNTNNRIPKLIENTSAETTMYIVNATYFKGSWKSAFEKKNTAKKTFYAEDKTTQDIQMMNQESTFNYSSEDNYSCLELPYGNKAFSMVILLPNEGKTITDAINSLNSDSWSSTLSKLKPKAVNLDLPRFKLSAKYDLEKLILPQMGMIVPFDQKLADFTGINKSNDLHISAVSHNTFVEVDEEGTEAAAVTKVDIGITSLPESQIQHFNVNKPFLFVITEKSTEIILFIGKIGKITQ